MAFRNSEAGIRILRDVRILQGIAKTRVMIPLHP